MEAFRRINDQWFLTEPLLFAVLCTHRLVENRRLAIPMRTGHLRVEYNPEVLARHSDEEVAEYLKIEMIRILLKHPYQRQPFQAVGEALGASSTVTIAENYEGGLVPLPRAKDFGLPPDLSFEEYYRLLADGLKGPGGADGQGSSGAGAMPGLEPPDGQNPFAAYGELAALWEEDNLVEHSVNRLIVQAEESKAWGTISGDMVELIEATLVVKLDYRRILNSFRASVLSSERLRTRMRPSRRYGFQYMGSKHEFSTRLLVAVDVSGSVEADDLVNFFSVINRFFKYGIQQVDVLQFDSEVKGELLSLRKARKSVAIIGRGGTNFQPVFDYLCDHPHYDGLIIFSDGHAPAPQLRHPVEARILWIFDSETNYNEHIGWVRSMPRSGGIWID
ncbi:MAG: hypothetical protein CSA07_02050 [Bacteroidia bacterium]|nr:MAG: hypothetical protein CSA07_02050 [Bacteroidia bacterium]